MVAGLNPAWNVPCTDSEIDQRFEKASLLMGEAFLAKLDFYGKSWLPARAIVVDALSRRKELDSKGRILHLPQFCPWKVSPLSPQPLLVLGLRTPCSLAASFLAAFRVLIPRNISSTSKKTNQSQDKYSTSSSPITRPPHTESKPCP